ncbi:RNA polymerase sigma factor [Staphylococcus argensis]|uniref:RNA polymerase sigma factor SigS n=1 Tax=Staphylococcus argensis TaxID=1607738 RepID=A0A2K4FCW5_9STAP|nr:sigma-70 family RNA polymerase sigma factor [Staphylococcus argensis]MCY6990954.1 sigma-70 family RNA polymerase sigma factor [Staphylococcus argensis]POA09200.1 hypothetical protein CD039_00085 [Staphylococcus argensis]
MTVRKIPLKTSTTATPLTYRERQQFEFYYPRLHEIVHAQLRCYRMPQADKEDLYQETMLKLLRVITHFEFKDRQPLDHYVRKVVKSVKNDYLRYTLKCEMRQESLINDRRAEYQEVATQDPVVTFMTAKSEREILAQHIETLSRIERAVIYFIIQGFEIKEIAKLLNKDHKAIYNAIHRAKVKLREALLTTESEV